MLTEQQVTHFETFGFLILRKLFSPEELETIHAEHERGLAVAVAHTASDRLNWSQLGPETPFFASLPEDPRISGVAERLRGEDVVGMTSNCNRMVGDTRWHEDQKNPFFYGMKFVYYLEPLDGNSGALRFIPGSHKNPLHDELQRIVMKGPNGEGSGEAGLAINDVPAYICETEPGDVIAFDFAIWHASWGGSTNRTMCSMDFYKNPKTSEEIEATRDQLKVDADIRSRLDSAGPAYDPHWVSNPGGSPRRQRWINWLREYGFIEAA